MKLLRREYTFSELFILKKSFLKLLLSPRKILNFILIKISLILRMERSLGLPINMLIEPTGMCNQLCIKCARYSKMFNDEGDVYRGKNIPFDHYCKIIDEVGDALLTLRLWRYGEPLLNRDLYRMIAYAKRKNILVSVSSSLSALTEDTAEKLVRSGLDYLIVSFDGASEETYNLYHGVRCYHQVVKNIKNLVRLKRKLKLKTPFIDLQFIVMKGNEHEMDKMKTLSKELGVDKLSFIKLDSTYIDFDRFKRVSSSQDIIPTNPEYRLDSYITKRDNFCSIPWEETLVTYSGLVLPCTPDYAQEKKMGRLFNNGHYYGFKQYWNSDEYRSMRKQVLENIDGNNCCRICTKRNNTVKQHITSESMEVQ